VNRSVLAAALVLALTGGCKRAQQIGRGEARFDANTIRAAAAEWRVEHGACPTVAQLVADHVLVLDPSEHHRERYTIQDEKDPWGNAYEITCDGDIVVRSYGPDGKKGTPDDVAVP
jgi:hypothetical protein